MKNIVFLMVFLISVLNSKEYVDVSGWDIVYNPAAIDHGLFNSSDFNKLNDLDKKKVAMEYFKENIATISPAYCSLSQSDKNKVYEQYISDAFPDDELVYTQYKNIAILFIITAILLGIIFYKRKSILSLYQRIKSQPVAVKRFAILASSIWVIIMSMNYRVSRWFEYRFDARDFNDYFMATYLPLIILYGIYWIISGIKKE